jgi:hypothetical protein
MKKSKVSLLAAALLLVLIAPQANAFIFTDFVAEAQRIEQMSQVAEYIQMFDTYRQVFDQYKAVFDDYYNSFHLVFSRLPAADWIDFSPSNWDRLTDHVITIWKTFDEGAWQSQVLALKTTPLYSNDPDYQAYADNLISLSEQQVARLKQEEADLIDLEAQDGAHNAAIQRFESRNGELVIGENDMGNEVALSQQIALTNAILIELASIQAETKVVEQRLLTDQKEERNLVMSMKQLEIDAQNGDFNNLNYLSTLSETR